MTAKSEKRVFAGYYTRYNGKRIYVVRVVQDIDTGEEIAKEVYEDGFLEPKRKPFTYKDDEYQPHHVRHSKTYLEYAKDICKNYRLDLRRRKLIKECYQYIGVDNHAEYTAMCEDLTFLRQAMKAMLGKHLDIFNARFAKGLSVQKSAEELWVNRSVLERRQAALHEAFAQFLQAREQANGVYRIENYNES